MRIALVRGINLNKYESQLFERLGKGIDITAFVAKGNRYSLDEVKLRVEQVLGMESLVPSPVRYYADYFMSRFLQVRQPMFGLASHLTGYEIVHTAEASYYYSYQIAQAKHSEKYKLVATQAETMPTVYGQAFSDAQRISYTLKQVDLFVALTQKAAALLELLGVSKQIIRVIPFGVDTELFKPREKNVKLLHELGWNESDTIILFAGRLLKIKGVYELVYAAAKMFQKNDSLRPNTKFLLVGSGREKQGLRRLISNVGLQQNFMLLESQPYSRMPGFYNLCDIFVLPSVLTQKCAEQFGMVLLESMASGKAVVATRVGGIPEVVGEAAILCDPNDFSSLASGLEQLVENLTLRKQLGQLGRERTMEFFDVNKVAGSLKKAYEQVLS